MIVFFQIIFSLFALMAVGSVWKKSHEGLLGAKGTVFWILFWVLAATAVWWPKSTTILANTFGIGRGADLILYISLAVIFYILFKLNVKIEGLSRGVTKLVREKALREVEKK